jgi:hypothetical protein
VSFDVRTVAIVGAAVAAPSLAMAGARVGVPIPAHVTAAQRAAVAELERAGLRATATGSAANMCAHRVAVWTNTQPLDKLRARTLCDALMSACHAGVVLNDPQQYELTPGQRLGGPGPDLREAIWRALEDADDDGLTELGRAAKRVKLARGNLVLSVDDDDITAAKRAADRLAIEMDDKGYLITGAPVTLGDELSGGLDAAATATKKFITERSADAALAAARAVAELVLGSPVLFAAVGLVAWRVLR